MPNEYEEMVGVINSLVHNEVTTRAALMQSAFNTNRDIDSACGYPKLSQLEPSDYRSMYDDHGVATRVVEVYPESTWSSDPSIQETEDSEPTEWELEFLRLENRIHLFGRLSQGDELSGVGQFGVLFFGLDDGKDPRNPIEGVEEFLKAQMLGDDPPIPKATRRVFFVRAFDQSAVRITQIQEDPKHFRHGLPNEYAIKLDNADPSGEGTVKSSDVETHVHWTRCVHLADNRLGSEVYGRQRMRPVYHRLWDIRKILGGSGEMYWRGGFPGTTFEKDPDLVLNASEHMPDADDTSAQANAIRKLIKQRNDRFRNALAQFGAGLERHLVLDGMKANQLQPNIESPKETFDTQVRAVALSLGAPYRVFMGSEEAKLASEKDADAWDARIGRRRAKYVAPFIVRPVIDLLMAYGALSYVPEYTAEWTEANTETDGERAERGERMAKALTMYLAAGGEEIMAPVDFLTIILGLEADEADAVIDKADKLIEEQAPDEPEDLEPSAAEQEQEEDQVGTDGIPNVAQQS